MKRTLIGALCFCLLCLCLTGCEEKKQEKNQEKESTNLSQNEKINLNDNVYYYEDIQLTDQACGGFGFPLNSESILEERWFSSYNGLKYVDKMELFMHDDIIYDEEKEQEAKKEWDNLKKPSRGVTEFTLGYDNHEFYFGYWYINLVKDEEGTKFSEGDSYYELSQNLNKEINSFREKAYTIIKEKNGYRLQGTCGGPANEIRLLEETICDKYQLSCDRW